MLFNSIYQEQDTSHAATQAPPHAWRAHSSCGETEQWLRLSYATTVWDHEEAVRPVSGRSGLRLGFYRSAPRAPCARTAQTRDATIPTKTLRAGPTAQARAGRGLVKFRLLAGCWRAGCPQRR